MAWHTLRTAPSFSGTPSGQEARRILSLSCLPALAPPLLQILLEAEKRRVGPRNEPHGCTWYKLIQGLDHSCHRSLPQVSDIHMYMHITVSCPNCMCSRCITRAASLLSSRTPLCFRIIARRFVAKKYGVFVDSPPHHRRQQWKLNDVGVRSNDLNERWYDVEEWFNNTGLCFLARDQCADAVSSWRKFFSTSPTQHL